jgi:hypothetical protein
MRETASFSLGQADEVLSSAFAICLRPFEESLNELGSCKCFMLASAVRSSVYLDTLVSTCAGNAAVDVVELAFG